MHIREFVQKNNGRWQEYNSLLVRARNPENMTAGEIDRFMWLYRSMTNDLARARSIFPGSEIERELNDYVSQGYDFIYNGQEKRDNLPAKIAEFFVYSFPQNVRKNYRFVLVSFMLTVIFTVAGMFLDRIDARLPYAIVPHNLMKQFEREIKERGRVERDINFEDRSIFSSFLIRNNITVSFNAFALGVSFGLGTIYILALNGLVLGCLGVMFYQNGQTLNYLAFIMPHGVVELTAIIISGGAGLMIGYSLLNPGERTRLESFKHGAGEAVEMIFGVCAMLVVAGLIEAFFTPIKTIPDLWKLVFSGVLFALMVLYFARNSASGKRASAEVRNG